MFVKPRLLGSISIALLAVVTGALLASAPVTAKPTAQSAAPASAVLVRPHSPVIGPKTAPVTIVEFFDPSCEACRAWYPVVKMIMAEYPKDVRLVIRFLPLHKGSEEAIRIIEAGRAQGKFIAVLEAVLEKQPEWHDGDLSSAWEAAEAVGLDVVKARASLQSRKVTAALAQDQADKAELGVRGTPAFFVNGEPLAQFSPQQLYSQVKAEVDASRSSPSE